MQDSKADARREQDRLERERIKRMSPEEQAKLEEKQRRREMKK